METPGRRVAAGALVRGVDGRILLVRPTYKPGWEIPGGVVEADESPREGCAREIDEELGLPLAVGRLLVVDWVPALAPRGDLVLFVFDGGVVDDAQLAAIKLQEEELSEWQLVREEELGDHLRPGMARRLAAAVRAAGSGQLLYLEWGDELRSHDDTAPPIVVRRARPGDARAMAEVQLRAALAGYGHIFPAEAPPPTADELTELWLAAIVAGDRAAMVADDGRRIVGTVLAAIDEDEPTVGFLARLYVEPDLWGSGIGTALYDASMTELRRRGHTSARLWVLELNTRARAMYERRGWRYIEGVTKPTWGDIVDVRYELDL